jgi:hypothetical protein
MSFMTWPEIEAFHHIRKFLRVDPTEWWLNVQLLSGTSTVAYKAKVKLHGTNAAIQCHKDGTVVVQSRTNIITPGNDNAGFARWVSEQEGKNATAWSEVRNLGGSDMVIYGEWCGPTIQKGVALAQLPNKIFAVFAARSMETDSDRLIIEPAELAKIVNLVPDTYVLPWYDKSIDINWKQTDEELTKATEEISKWVLEVEANDPWVEATFGIKGTGEGLVFYPTSTPHLGWANFQNLVFKAKGDKHKNIKTAAPAQVNAESAASIDSFVELVLTPARSAQGATAVGGFDMKLTGKFVQWIVADVKKETQDELEASNLTWDQVEKPLSAKARTWYLTEAKK